MAFRSLRHSLAALLVLLFLATGAAAVQVRVTPASSNGVVGSTVTVTVEADSVTALGGFQFGFGYSTTDLQVVSTTVNPAFDQVVKQDQGTATGSGMIAATVFNNAAVTGAPVTLATIDFKILTPVAGNITLANVILGQVGGAEIASTSLGGTVAGNNTYTVTYNGNSNSAGVAPSDGNSYATGAAVTVLGNGSLTKTGCTFAGWNTAANGSGTAYVANSVLSIGASNVTLYAQWTVVPNYTVSFTSNGGSAVSSQIVMYNTIATTPAAPTKNGYSFAGWFSDAGLTVPFVFTTPITADITLYAKWTINNYTVTFNSNGGSAVSSQSIVYNTIATTPTAPPKTGYSFAGWYSDAGLTVPFVFTTPVTTDISLYAKWTINSYSVTFNSNGGSAVSSQVVLYNTVATAPSAPTKTGYSFSGWYSDAGLAVPFVFITPVTADITLYAKWSINNYTVTFASNGGSTVTSQVVPFNTLAILPAAPTKTGYTFTGWYSDVGLTTPFVFSTPVTANTTLYAQWNINSYTLTYTAGVNGTISGATPQNVNYSASGTAVIAVANSGYHFVQWSDGGTSAVRTDNNITASFSVSATFASDPVNGVCDPASNGRAFASPPTTGLCTVGTATEVSGTGPWSWSCLGLNGGNNAVCSASIDITGPALFVSTLANGAITNNVTLNISGTVSDVSGVASLTINAAPVTVTNGSFSHAVTLQPGSNINTTIATDTLGNSTTDGRTITLDALAPVLTVTTPADNSRTAQSVATVTGTINKNSIVSVTVSVNNGTPQSASITGSSYSASANLSAGLNTIAITVTTTDVSGNISSAVRTVTYDSANPSLAITDPNQDITTSQNSITISGTVSDIVTSATVTLTFNNQTYTPTINNGIFSQTLTIPSAGKYPITATAVDMAGNSSTVTRNIIYALDTAAPGIISFTMPTTSNAPAVAIITFTATDSVGVTGYLLKETPVPPLPLDPVWSSTPPTTYNCRTWGNNTLYAYTKDAAGNISAPKLAVVLIGPTDGIIVPGPQKLEPTLADAIKSLNFAMKVVTPNSAEFAGANVSPLVNGIPQPPSGKTTINLGDTIVTLRRVIGL